jgi:HlyD family secretion protein
MTAYVSIPVATAASVLKVPNGALRYKPDLSAEEIRALYQKSGIPENAISRGQTSRAEAAPAAAARPQGGNARKSAGRAGETSARIEEAQAPKFDTQIVWKLNAEKELEPVRIKTGITDHTFTEVLQDLNGDLKAGDELITGLAQGRASGAPRPGGPAVPRGR